ncbi:MAG: hypothetical protein ACI814_004670 [Mariniblastus sp.]|jgi:hypothetical protein
MFILAVIAFFATLAFFRRAKSIGVSPGRAASLPWVVFGVFAIVAFVAEKCFESIFSNLDISPGIASAIVFAFDAMFVLAYLQFIKKNWEALKSRQRTCDVS